MEQQVELARTSKGFVVWIGLILSAILVHALLPVGSPLQRSTGSPFSATTVEVSIAPSRKNAQLEAEDASEASGASAKSDNASADDDFLSIDRANVAVSRFDVTSDVITLAGAAAIAAVSRSPPARAPPAV